MSLRFLRPYTFRPLATTRSSRCSAYLSFYELSKIGSAPCCRRKQSNRANEAPDAEKNTAEERSAFVANRIARLKQTDSLRYPRAENKKKRVAVHDFCEAYNEKSQEELSTINDCVTVTGTPAIVVREASLMAANKSSGRVMHIRRFGSKFFFLHIRDNGKMLQVQVNWGKLDAAECPLPDFKKLAKRIDRGDFVCTSINSMLSLGTNSDLSRV